MHSQVQTIALTFATVGRPLPGSLVSIPAALASTGSLKGAIQSANPAALLARLKREASDLDDREERARAEAADYLGRAAYRAARNPADPVALDLQRQGEAAEAVAADYQSQAERKRAEAIGLIRFAAE